VDYQATILILEDHFKDCGKIIRTTIRTGVQGQPLGYAYMEFATMEGAIRSKIKNETLLLGRQITVMQKRKNLPKPKQRPNPTMYAGPNSGGTNPMMM